DCRVARMIRLTIGPDKRNQLRHVRFLRDAAGLRKLMDQHRALLAPKFAAVAEALGARLDGTGAARWTRPDGGYSSRSTCRRARRAASSSSPRGWGLRSRLPARPTLWGATLKTARFASRPPIRR